MAFRPQNTLVLTAAELETVSLTALGQLLNRAAASGIGDVIIEIDEMPTAIIAAVLERGLRLFAGVTCFHEHGTITLENPSVTRPIDADGSPRERLEWYTGLIPTDPYVVDELIQRCARLARTPGVSGLVLDFIRWPLHWELEARETGPSLPAASFDPQTLTAFARWADGSGDEAAPLPSSRQLLGNLLPQWTEFRCQVVTDIVERISRAIARTGASLGAFVVPIPSARRKASTGQDVAAWEPFIDALYPMTYHAIMQRSPEWIGTIVDELRTESGHPVVPVVQLTADKEFADPWDWGEQFGLNELSRVLQRAAEGGPVAAFPGTALRAPQATLLTEAVTVTADRR